LLGPLARVAPLLHKRPISAEYADRENTPGVSCSGIGQTFSTKVRGRLPEYQGVIRTGVDKQAMMAKPPKIDSSA